MIDLNAKIPGAPNFRYGEFTKSSTAIRHGINNIPESRDQWRNIEILARNVLQPIREEFGRLRILSGYRSRELNTLIKGSSTSNHCFGYAADIEPLEQDITLLDVLIFIHDKLGYRELIAEYFPNGWIHVAYRKGENTKQLKLKDDSHHYARVSKNYIIDLYKD